MTQCEPLTHDKEETADTRNGCTHLPAAALSLTASSLELSRHASRILVILCRYTDNSQHLRQEYTHSSGCPRSQAKIRKPNTSHMHFRTHLRLPRFSLQIFSWPQDVCTCRSQCCRKRVSRVSQKHGVRVEDVLVLRRSSRKPCDLSEKPLMVYPRWMRTEAYECQFFLSRPSET